MLDAARAAIVRFYLRLPAPIDPFALQTSLCVYIVDIAAGRERIGRSAFYDLCVLHIGIMARLGASSRLFVGTTAPAKTESKSLLYIPWALWRVQ